MILCVYIQHKLKIMIEAGQNTKKKFMNYIKRLMHSIKCKNVNILNICYNLNSKSNDFTINAKISVLSSI